MGSKPVSKQTDAELIDNAQWYHGWIAKGEATTGYDLLYYDALIAELGKRGYCAEVVGGLNITKGEDDDKEDEAGGGGECPAVDHPGEFGC